jgi:hypothetical protein
MIDSTQAEYVSSQTATTWTLRSTSSVKAGDVLLLEDAAVKVLSVDTSTGQVVLTVRPAEIEEVFSKLSLHQTFDQNSAEFIPDPSSQIPATFGPPTASPRAALSNLTSAVSASVEKEMTIPYDAPPFSARLTFKILGRVNLDYDNSTNAGLIGKLDVTGIVGGDVLMSADGAIQRTLREKSIATLRIPLSLTVIDLALDRIGVRVVSIAIPVSVGAEAHASFAVGVGINGTAQSNVITAYDSTDGFSVIGPTNSATLALIGIPSSTVPQGASTGSLEAGPFVRARPQLLILNKVASIGADVKVGLYGQGQMSSFLSPPYYCLNLQASVRGEGFGFFKGIGITTYQSPPIRRSLEVGPPFVFGSPDCTTTVQFSISDYTVIDTAEAATITVTRVGNTSNVSTVQYGTSDGTARAGLDYTSTSGILTFNPGEVNQTFTIPILNPIIQEARTVDLTLTHPNTGTSLGVQRTAVLTIHSRQLVQFSSPTYTVNQTAGIATIKVTRKGDTSKAASVRYETKDGTALAGQDYIPPSGILVFSPNETSQTFAVPILNNPAALEARTVQLKLIEASDGTIGVPNSALLTIIKATAQNTLTITGAPPGIASTFVVQNFKSVRHPAHDSIPASTANRWEKRIGSHYEYVHLDIADDPNGQFNVTFGVTDSSGQTVTAAAFWHISNRLDSDISGTTIDRSAHTITFVGQKFPLASNLPQNHVWGTASEIIIDGTLSFPPP